jgi:hypothetical protein
MGYQSTNFAPSVFASCAKVAAVSWAAIQDCHQDANRALKLQNRAAKQTPADHTYVPWVVVDGVHIHDSDDDVSNSLLAQICNVYIAKGGTHPACDDTVDWTTATEKKLRSD